MRFVVLWLAMMAVASPARAHSWYPHECCADHDCMPADAIYSDRQGERIVVVGKMRVRIPANFSARPSPDGRVHVCYVQGESGFPLPRCLFLPPEF